MANLFGCCSVSQSKTGENKKTRGSMFNYIYTYKRRKNFFSKQEKEARTNGKFGGFQVRVGEKN